MHKKALVTGATRGLGRAIAIQLINDGYEIVAIARTEADLLELSNAYPDRITPLVVDIGKSNITEVLRSELKQTQFNSVVHNVANYLEDSNINDVDIYQSQLETNFYSILRINDYLLNGHIKQNAHFLFIGSIVSREPRAKAAAYSVSKAALASYVKSFADTVRDSGIKTCLISPGSINTSSWGNNHPKAESMIQPEDIALLVSTILKLSTSTWVEEIIVNPFKKGI